MIAAICLFWIGTQLNAPSWYYALLIVFVVMKVFSFGINMYKEGKKKGES